MALSTSQIQEIYQAVLQRATTNAEVSASNNLDSMIGDAGAVAAIVDSAEAQQYVYPIVQIILLATGSLPTAGQLAGWVPAVESGTSLDQMAFAFVASSQFGNTYNGGTAVNPNAPITGPIVSEIIQHALDTTPTQAQVNAWTSTGMTIDQVFVDFSLGDQYSAFIRSGVQQYLTQVAANAAGISTSGLNVVGAKPYVFSDLAAGLGTQSAANSINDSGAVAGNYTDNSGGQHGFIFSSGTYSILDDPSANGLTHANGINNAGQVVGVYLDSNAISQGFIYSGGNFTTLSDPLGIQGTTATAINNLGETVGYYIDASGLAHGFTYQNGSFTSSVTDPAAGTASGEGTYITGINDQGALVGYFYDAVGTPHGFLYSGGSFTTINDPQGAQGTFASGINNAGQIVGTYIDANGNQHGFLDNNGSYLTTDDPFGVGGSIATAINNTGQIVGDYFTSSQTEQAFSAGAPALVTNQIQGVYQAILQRSPTNTEINASVALDSTFGNAGAIAAIVDSAEAQQHVYPIVQIILLATGNMPTSGQLAGWVPAVESGTTLDQMAFAFVASTQFGNTYNSGTAVDPNAPITAPIVTAIIEHALDVTPSQAQVNAWVSTGMTIDQVFVDFSLGDQYSAFIQSTVQAYLGERAIDGAGLTALDGVNTVGTLGLGTTLSPITQPGLTVLGGSGPLVVAADGAGDAIIALNTSSAGSTITADGPGDVITLAGGANAVTANGNGDVITLGAISTGTSITAAQTVHAAGSNDVITFATMAADGTTITWAGSSIVDGGSVSPEVGANATVNFGNNVGAGTETVVITGDFTQATSTGTIAMTTLNNVVDGAGDQLLLNNAGTEVLLKTAIPVSSAASLGQAFDMAAAAAAASQPNHQIGANTGVVDWFQYGGNTYVLEAINATGTPAAHPALAATDEVAMIVGTVSLTAITLALHTLTL